MPFIIDGHNLIGKISGIHLAQMDDEEKLIRRVLKYCNSAQKQAEIYFDRAAPGGAGKRKYGRVTAVFVDARRTADDAIHRRLAGLKRQARNWTVVSSDRRVQVEARAMGAGVITSEDFVEMMENERFNNASSGNAPLDDDEIADWLKAFGAGDDD